MKALLVLFTAIFSMAVSAQEAAKVDYYLTPQERIRYEEYEKAEISKGKEVGPAGSGYTKGSIFLKKTDTGDTSEPRCIWFTVRKIDKGNVYLVTWGDAEVRDGNWVKKDPKSNNAAALLNMPGELKVGDVYARVVSSTVSRYSYNGQSYQTFTADLSRFDPFKQR